MSSVVWDTAHKTTTQEQLFQPETKERKRNDKKKYLKQTRFEISCFFHDKNICYETYREIYMCYVRNLRERSKYFDLYIFYIDPFVLTLVHLHKAMREI
jgi:hypothetical protein